MDISYRTTSSSPGHPWPLLRAPSSVVERHAYTVHVTGSIPVGFTTVGFRES